jgi:hypothetical protein
MKKVFQNCSEVIHCFAQQTQDEGRSSNVFFEGKKIYSYGHHYLLAEFITNPKNEQAIMINDTGYSATTSGHISAVRSATRHYRQFFICSTGPKKVLNQLENIIEKLKKAHKPEMYISQANQLYNSFCEFLIWNGEEIKNFPEINAAIAVFNTKDYTTYYLQKEKAIIQAAKIAKAKKAKDDRIKVKKFMKYEINSCYGLTEDFCRLSLDGQFVETTQHVKVSINEAKILYQLIKAGKDIKGHRIDNYTVIGINGNLQIGCHRINKKNMHEIGLKLINS